jgi:hypothetical protein
MRATSIAIAACLTLAFLALPVAFPATDDLSPVGAAQARPPCVIGQNGCVIPIYCFTDPCPNFP